MVDTAMISARRWAAALGPHRGLATLLLLALLLRLTISPYGGYDYDLDTFRVWAVQLTSHPPWDFYELEPAPDKLPGDLWLLWGIGQVSSILSGDAQPGGEAFVWLVKLAAAVGDLAVGVGLYVAITHLATRRVAMLAATAYLFNPASIYLSSVWGQLDSIPLAAATAGVALFLIGHPRLAFPLLTYAALIKPQYGALVPLLVLARLWGPEAARGEDAAGPERRTALLDIAIGGAASAVLASVILLPYGVGIPPLGQWSILDRVSVAVDKWPFASMYALNLWAAVDPPVRGLVPDSKEWLFGLTYRSWGMVGAGAGYASVLAIYGWKRSTPALLWAVAATMFLLFLFPTRVHERYVFPIIGLVALLLPFGPGYLLVYVGASLACLANLYFAYSLIDPPELVSVLSESRFFYTYTSMLNIALLLVMTLLTVGPRQVHRAESTPVARAEE